MNNPPNVEAATSWINFATAVLGFLAALIATVFAAIKKVTDKKRALFNMMSVCSVALPLIAAALLVVLGSTILVSVLFLMESASPARAEVLL